MPSAWRRRRSRRPPSSTWCASTPFPTSCRRSAPRTALPGPFGREGCSGSRTPAAAASSTASLGRGPPPRASPTPPAAASSTASIGRGPPPCATISCRPRGSWIASCAGPGSVKSRSRTAPTASWRGPSIPRPFSPAPLSTAMPEPSSAGAARPFRFLTLSTARELGILLCLSVMFPFMIHVIPVPEDSQLGPRLLPIFYAPLLASLLRRSGTAAAVALLAPWLNWALTSHPAPTGAIVMTVELVVFVLAVRALLARSGPRWYLAAPAFLFCKAGSALAATAFPELNGGAARYQ